VEEKTQGKLRGQVDLLRCWVIQSEEKEQMVVKTLACTLEALKDTKVSKGQEGLED
jgi:hypothetical protein